MIVNRISRSVRVLNKPIVLSHNRHNSSISAASTSSSSPASSAAESTNTTAAADAGKWTTIYKFPHIQAIAGLNKMKVYQAAFTSLSIPICMGLESAAVLPEGCVDVVTALGITGTIALTVASFTVGRNVVGFAYVDNVQSPARVRLSCPDFWGRRRNVDVPVEHIVSQLDVRRVPLDAYIRVKCSVTDKDGKSQTETFKLAHRHGEILRPNEFTYAFGEC